MKMCNLKMWLPGMILGLSFLAAVPVSADITNSGSTPPDRILRMMWLRKRDPRKAVIPEKYMILRIPKLPV